MCVEQEGGTWSGFEGYGGTPCVFAERRNINNTGKAKRDGPSNKNEAKYFQGLKSSILISLLFLYFSDFILHPLQLQIHSQI
jgi:hypothetical protein